MGYLMLLMCLFYDTVLKLSDIIESHNPTVFNEKLQKINIVCFRNEGYCTHFQIN